MREVKARIAALYRAPGPAWRSRWRLPTLRASGDTETRADEDVRLRSSMLRLHIGARLVFMLAAGWSAEAGADALRRDFHFQTIGSEQGLAQNSVNAILQDHAGYLWVGTQAGLQRYDGYGFRTFETAGGDPAATGEAPVSALIEDADGTIWIGTGGTGVEKLDASRGTIERVPIAKERRPSSATCARSRSIPATASGSAPTPGSRASMQRHAASGGAAAAARRRPHRAHASDSSRRGRHALDRKLLGLFRLPHEGAALERVGGEALDDVATL